MSEHPNPEPHNPDQRPAEWPATGMTRHTLVLKGIAEDGEEVPVALTFEYPEGKGMVGVRTLRDFSKPLGMELMRQLHERDDASVTAIIETTVRDLKDQGIDLENWGQL